MQKNQLTLFELGQIISFTQVSNYLRCPLEYKLRFVDKREAEFTPKGIEVTIGRVLHKITHDYFSVEPEKRSEDLVDEKVRKAMGEGNWTNITEMRIRESAFSLHRSVLSRMRVRGLEMPIRTAIGKYVLTGRLDILLEDKSGIHIVEFKVIDYLDRENESSIDRYLQLISYVLGLRDLGLHPKSASFFFFDSGLLDSMELNSQLIATGRSRLEEILNHLTSEVQFLPKLNRLCGTCGYRTICPLWSTETCRSNTSEV